MWRLRIPFSTESRTLNQMHGACAAQRPEWLSCEERNGVRSADRRSCVIRFPSGRSSGPGGLVVAASAEHVDADAPNEHSGT